MPSAHGISRVHRNDRDGPGRALGSERRSKSRLHATSTAGVEPYQALPRAHQAGLHSLPGAAASRSLRSRPADTPATRKSIEEGAKAAIGGARVVAAQEAAMREAPPRPCTLDAVPGPAKAAQSPITASGLTLGDQRSAFALNHAGPSVRPVQLIGDDLCRAEIHRLVRSTGTRLRSSPSMSPTLRPVAARTAIEVDFALRHRHWRCGLHLLAHETCRTRAVQSPLPPTPAGASRGSVA